MGTMGNCMPGSCGGLHLLYCLRGYKLAITTVLVLSVALGALVIGVRLAVVFWFVVC